MDLLEPYTGFVHTRVFSGILAGFQPPIEPDVLF